MCLQTSIHRYSCLANVQEMGSKATFNICAHFSDSTNGSPVHHACSCTVHAICSTPATARFRCTRTTNVWLLYADEIRLPSRGSIRLTLCVSVIKLSQSSTAACAADSPARTTRQRLSYCTVPTRSQCICFTYCTNSSQSLSSLDCKPVLCRYVFVVSVLKLS